MSDVDRLFADLKAKQQKALMPFLTAGDPNISFTARAMSRLEEVGCHLFEVGFPYSDPIADGPIIQASYTRLLDRGLKQADIWQLLKNTQSMNSPRVGMCSYAIIHRRGLREFTDMANGHGVAGLIVPDLLVEESGPLRAECQARDISLIPLITPTTPPDRARRIADAATGFIYYVSITGITGERTQLPPELTENVSWLKEQTPLPICIGFGISQPEHVRLLAPVADGLIVGSAFVRRVAEAADIAKEETVLAELEKFAKGLLAELSSTSG
ncbi:MAG TPA: tryptophan synthase subunit alpha [Planctomycetes bacterium]|jgi:tryptophan synthase alpha chain|nr:tryptophan synthase subunit alpha [Planctomycetaceae bacterium]HIM28902.1 tryptophan synthase subunit alpha [Planctomycetota bacterium]